MQINWNKIEQEFPKGYNCLIYNCSIRQFCGKLNNICFYDIERFFDSYGIQITIFALRYEEFLYRIYDKNHHFVEDDIIYKTRDDAEEQAIYKAFEILEEQLR